MYKHICGFCANKNCPEAGNEKYDGMVGPTIACQRYKSSFLSLDWFARWSLLLGLIAGVLYIIHYVVT